MGLFRLRLLLKRNKMSLVIPPTFQHILRVMNTNIDGKRNIQYAITAIKGVGRRYANLFLNRQKDIKDGKTGQVMANFLDNKLREDLERLKKIRAHRGLRHYWGLRTRGQHTKTTGRRGRTVGVSKKK